MNLGKADLKSFEMTARCADKEHVEIHVEARSLIPNFQARMIILKPARQFDHPRVTADNTRLLGPERMIVQLGRGLHILVEKSLLVSYKAKSL
jgi:hypothetical protein